MPLKATRTCRIASAPDRKLNGHDAGRRIREQPWGQTMTLIALTGWGQEDDVRRSQDAGFDRHMVKPVDPVALMQQMAGLQPARA